MTTCEYVTVQNSIKKSEDEDYKTSWKQFLTQLTISSSTWSTYFQFGLCLGAITVIIPRMREEHGEDYVTRGMASSISSAMMYAGVPWAPVIVYLASAIGRRYTFALLTIINLVGFTILSIGDTPIYVLVGMIVLGPLASSIVTITLLVLTEYTSPEYRGIFLTIKSATSFWGIWAANAIGTVANWHYIAWLGLACASYNLVTLFIWPESPYWLASKGRLGQCRKAHCQLKGYGPSSNKELQELIKGNQPDFGEDGELSDEIRQKFNKDKLRQIFSDMKSKCFIKSVFYNWVLALQYNFCGKSVCSIYAIDILKDITKSEHEAYKGMLILDGVTVLGMYIGCGLSKKLSRRMLLISAGGAGSVFMLIMSMYLFLVRFEFILENKYTTLIILTCYSLAVSCGPIILNSSLGGELLLPINVRGIAAVFLAMFANFLFGTIVKLAPYIFSTFGTDGTFLFYAITSGSFLVVLYIYLPETKDKTLKEIEDSILGIKTK